MAGNWALGEPRLSARFRLLYCKMRCVHEASFLACRRRVNSRTLPAVVLRLEVSVRAGRYGALRATGHELAAAPHVRHACRWRSCACGSAHAGVPRIFGPDLRDYGTHRCRRAAVRHYGAGGGVLVYVSIDGESGGAAGIAQAGSGVLAARLSSHLVDCSAVPLYGKLRGG